MFIDEFYEIFDHNLVAAGSMKLDVKYALAVSPTRRQLHKQGKYVPAVYALIWPREESLSRADKTNTR